MRKAARVDATQAAIVKALRKVGAAVEVIGKPLDLIVCFRGKTSLVECKTTSGRLTRYQVEFLARWPGDVHIVQSPEAAVAAVVGMEAMK